jgi:hypothetical protein
MDMGIPKSQLETWSHQGSISQSSNTYNAIKRVLEDGSTPYAGKDFKVFLQGSYGNDTNIYAESDVDIIIRLDSCFQSDLTELDESEKVAYKSAFRDATYTYADFKRDVLSVLMRQYGNSVTSGSKAVVIDANGSRRKADVIAAIKYRRYLKFRSLNDSRYVEGICFWNGSGKLIANYPIQHSRNLTIKHQNTSNLLKPLARIFKNMRSRMVEEQLIKSSSAPSYFIEGLLYNVPNDKLTSSYEHSVVNVLNWYEHEASKKELVCANEQYYLLRDGSHVCWNQKDSDEFVAAAIELWSQW